MADIRRSSKATKTPSGTDYASGFEGTTNDDYNFLFSAIKDYILNSKSLPTGAFVGSTDTQALTNKTISALLNTITNIADAEIKAAAGINFSKLGNGDITNAVATFIANLTSDAQDQLDSKIDLDQQQAANSTGYSAVISQSGNYGIDINGALITTMTNITTTQSQEVMIIARTYTTGQLTIAAGSSDTGFIDATGRKNDYITMNAADECVYLKSPSVPGGRWMVLGGNGYTMTDTP